MLYSSLPPASVMITLFRIFLFCGIPLLIWILYIIFYKNRGILAINMLDFPVELRLILFPTKHVHKIFLILPRCDQHISPGEFNCFHEHNPYRPALMSVVIDGCEVSGFCFNCHQLVSYRRITFGLDFQGRLVVTGVKAPQGLKKNLSWRFRGSYDGIKEDVIISGYELPVAK